jgi:hypothetical protein
VKTGNITEVIIPKQCKIAILIILVLDRVTAQNKVFLFSFIVPLAENLTGTLRRRINVPT